MSSRSIIGSRHIDVLTVSVGADDIKFSTIAKRPDPEHPDLWPLPEPGLDPEGIQGQPEAIAESLRRARPEIQKLDPGQVLVTDYPDITRDQNGNVAAILGPLDYTLISKRDARFASTKIIPALDQAVAAAANRYKWTLSRGSLRFPDPRLPLDLVLGAHVRAVPGHAGR